MAEADDRDAGGGVLRRAVAELDPGYFALVMATGIVSVGTDMLGHPVLSTVLFGFTLLAWVLLAGAYLWRAVAHPERFAASLRDPPTAMGYFTVVAGTNVVAVRLLADGHTAVAAALGAAAALLWLVLCYWLPWSVVAAANRPVLGEVNGTWLIWVVATQSVSIVASGLAPAAPDGTTSTALAAVALCLWSVGVMLYLVLTVMIFLRLLLVRITPAEMGPAYWIVMGATAITARAAAGLLALHEPQLAGLRGFVGGLSVLLWAFGSWWIPLLVLFGVWRYLLRGYPRSYEPRLWSVVFPLGMYTVASDALGRATGLSFLVDIARVWVWVGAAAWLTVACLLLVAAVRAVRAAPDRPA